MAVQEVATDIAYNVGGAGFRLRGWSNVFQMKTWDEMADYVDGRIAGVVLDANGNSTGERVETRVEAWHKIVGTRAGTLAAILRAADSSGEGGVAAPKLSPSLLSPGNGTIGVPTRPAFQWQAVDGATGYGLYVSEPPYGDAHLVYENDNLTGTAFTLPVTLESGVAYRWNMRAGNSAGWGPFSSPFLFTTEIAVVPGTGGITVRSDLNEASFTVAGPNGRQYQGAGTSWSAFDVPAGAYTVSYADVPGHATPRPETKTLGPGKTIAFLAEYGAEDQASYQPQINDVSISELIQTEENPEQRELVMLDGTTYYVVTLNKAIHPETLGAELQFETSPPSAYKVFTDTGFHPISDEARARRVGLTQRANYLASAVLRDLQQGNLGLADSVDSLLEAAGAMEEAEAMAEAAEIAAFATLDVAIGIETGDFDLLADLPVKATEDLAALAMKYEAYDLGKLSLLHAKEEYGRALDLAQSYPGGFGDYQAARLFLNSYHTAYFEHSVGMAYLLPNSRVQQSGVTTVVNWIPDYLGHLAASTVGRFRTFRNAATAIGDLAELTATGVESAKDAHEYQDAVRDMQQKAFQLLENDTFPVDYTLALANQDISLLFKWGVVGVDVLSRSLASHAELRVHDSNGNITGMVDGRVTEDIPNSFYENDTVMVFFPTDTYKTEIVGTGEGSYTLTMTRKGDGNVTLMAPDVPVSPGAIHQYMIEDDAPGASPAQVTMKIDSDGDGTYEVVRHLVQERTEFPWPWVATGVAIILALGIRSRPDLTVAGLAWLGRPVAKVYKAVERKSG